MAKQEKLGSESPEEKIEIPQTGTETREPSVDVAYSSEVQRYFNRRREDLMNVRENPDEEDLQYEQFLIEQQNILANVALTKKLEKMQPKDVGFALSELAGMMANNMEQDPNSTVDQNREYREAKHLFMATCRKIYPDIEPEKSASIAYGEAEKINKSVNMAGISIRLSEGTKLLRENPRELARQMDGIMHTLGDSMKTRAFSAFNSEDLKETEDYEKKLGMATISYYKMQLMRDALIKDVYGKDDLTPWEMTQIDQAKQKIK